MDGRTDGWMDGWTAGRHPAGRTPGRREAAANAGPAIAVLVFVRLLSRAIPHLPARPGIQPLGAESDVCSLCSSRPTQPALPKSRIEVLDGDLSVSTGPRLTVPPRAPAEGLPPALG